MDQETYFSNRLDDQIKWYDSKSDSCQQWYKKLRMIEIISAAAIPFIASIDALQYQLILTGGLGALIAILAGISTLYKFQENWLTYRTTCETLKHEKYLFLTKSAPYNSNNAFNLLVENAEAIMAKEQSQWAVITKDINIEKS